MTVIPTRQASTMNSGSVRLRNGSWSNPQRPSSSITGSVPCIRAKAKLMALQQKVVTKVVEPSILSHMDSKSLHAYVLTVIDFCLSQQSIAKLTNSCGSERIRVASDSPVFIMFMQIETKSLALL